MDPVAFGVLRVGRIDIFMTVEALGPVFHFVPIGIILSIPVHFCGSVALVAFKIFFLVDIGRDPFVFSQILLFDTAPVTGRAHRMHGGLFLKKMSLQKPPLHGLGSADVTLSTTGMALTAMPLSGVIHLFHNCRVIA
jgi:hypothetical protein